MRVDGEQVRPFDVDAAQHQRGRDVALVPEQVRLEHLQGRGDAGRAARGEAVQGQGRGDHARRVFRVGRGAGAAAVDVGGDEVDLLAVFVRDGGAGGGARVGPEDDAVLCGEERERGFWRKEVEEREEVEFFFFMQSHSIAFESTAKGRPFFCSPFDRPLSSSLSRSTVTRSNWSRTDVKEEQTREAKRGKRPRMRN